MGPTTIRSCFRWTNFFASQWRNLSAIKHFHQPCCSFVASAIGTGTRECRTTGMCFQNHLSHTQILHPHHPSKMVSPQNNLGAFFDNIQPFCPDNGRDSTRPICYIFQSYPVRAGTSVIEEDIGEFSCSANKGLACAPAARRHYKPAGHAHISKQTAKTKPTT